MAPLPREAREAGAGVGGVPGDAVLNALPPVEAGPQRQAHGGCGDKRALRSQPAPAGLTRCRPAPRPPGSVLASIQPRHPCAPRGWGRSPGSLGRSGSPFWGLRARGRAGLAPLGLPTGWGDNFIPAAGARQGTKARCHPASPRLWPGAEGQEDLCKAKPQAIDNTRGLAGKKTRPGWGGDKEQEVGGSTEGQPGWPGTAPALCWLPHGTDEPPQPRGGYGSHRAPRACPHLLPGTLPGSPRLAACLKSFPPQQLLQPVAGSPSTSGWALNQPGDPRAQILRSQASQNGAGGSKGCPKASPSLPPP